MQPIPKMMLTFVLVLITTSVVSSVKHEDSGDLSANVRDIVENILGEKNCNKVVEEVEKRLTKELEYLRKKVSTMEAQVIQQSGTIAKLQHQNKDVETIGEIQSDKEFDKKMDNWLTENTIPASDDTFAKLSTEKVLRGGRRVRRAVGNVAFSAYLSHTNEHTVVKQPIRFDQVLLNDGQGYNKYTGAFTAPLAGTYLFSFNFDARKLTFVRLVVNGVNQVDAVANAHTNVESRHAQSMGGNTVIVHVGHGEAVLVETYEIADGETASSNTFRLCSFSGVLLY